ncbi:hypothetical protein VFPBJ_05780 [Purpureocillium lilacinum]|uniref:Uncharacterized protein n=1 Tax=Purpureocillium lilacinum TaxID=33203 RepID=A0A179GQK7_PURLI|nr:hypothetical protein VFPBJ_05780 [Purpureocillium lilacinum]
MSGGQSGRTSQARAARRSFPRLRPFPYNRLALPPDPDQTARFPPPPSFFCPALLLRFVPSIGAVSFLLPGSGEVACCNAYSKLRCLKALGRPRGGCSSPLTQRALAALLRTRCTVNFS